MPSMPFFLTFFLNSLFLFCFHITLQSWTWKVPSMLFLKVVGLLGVMWLGGVHVVRVVGREEVMEKVIASIDWLEVVLQTLPLCPW